MRVHYKGISSEYNYRIAEIGYDDKEETLLAEVAELMMSYGWKIDIVGSGYALCEVDDYDDYKEFMEDWKKSKKEARNLMKTV